MKSRSQQGVALVVTLILLSVITFMTVTFLVISRREREAVIVRSSQSDASFAADAALEHAKAQFIAQMFIGTNGLAFDMMVSTNFINPAGFQPGLSSYTNVNYDHVVGSVARLSQADFLQNLTNLLILPRAPVFITTNKNQQVAEFRYYLDLNRNGYYDTNGSTVLLNSSGVLVTNVAVGDPEWIGILDHPDRPHSRSNLFVARYAFIALPIGNSLDINYIHNQAKRIKPTGDGFLRDQGVGSWEINLAAFLYTLNSNTYAWGGTYQYETNTGFNSVGNSFIDAVDILRYRYGGNNNSYNTTLATFLGLYGVIGANAIQNNHIDDYLHGALMTTPFGLQTDPDAPALVNTPWPGADSTNHFYTSQDLFSPDPTMFSFSNRLYTLGRLTNTFERYTFYNLLTQLGMDSAPDKPGKVHLNYKNINGVSATNFVAWTPLEFFTNAADTMLRAQFTNISITNIPVYSGTNYIYSPAVQRILQLAANIYDASTNRQFDATGTTNKLYYPSVFRPLFRIQNTTNVYVTGFVEVTNQTDYLTPPLDLNTPAGLRKFQVDVFKSGLANDNVYGVPYVIGAKKGFPNFNEFSMATVSQFTRRMQITKTSDPKPANWKYAAQYVVGVSNAFGVELWNSYTSSYPRDVRIYATNDLTMRITNDMGLTYTTNLLIGTNFVIPANTWPATPQTLAANTRLGLVLPLVTNFVFVPDSVFSVTPSAGFNTNLNIGFVGGPPTDRAPQWGVSVTNRVRVILQDDATKRLIDYVQLGGMGDYVHVTQFLQPPAADQNSDIKNLWNTNKLTTAPPNLTKGINSQIQLSLGNQNAAAADWTPYMILPGGYNKNFEIDKFRAFYGLGPLYGGYTAAQLAQIAAASNSLTAQVPFTPTAKIDDYRSWQANDPLVHYILADLTDLQQSANKPSLLKPGFPMTNTLPNMRLVNTRYQPWGGNQQNPDDIATRLEYKDPMITRSDDWNFPTNKFPNVGWLGRVHRGTPWQTVYLKSGTVATNRWQLWTGNALLLDSGMTQPTNDWALLDLFTTAINENASHGQLSVNQTNPAPWAAVLGGVIALTNTTETPSLFSPPTYTNVVIDPAVHYLGLSNIVAGINRSRNTANYPGQVFQHLGDVLSAPELTVASPFLNLTGDQTNYGISDAIYERIPQQTLSLLRLGEPRYVIYSYGQSLKPADKSVIQSSGPYFGVPTNYTITGEVVTRSVVRVDNYPTPGPGKPNTQPHVVLESYTVLPPE